ncbi:MAG: hypothetical protein AB7O62_08715 [Pirellulales bacterium]
MNGIDKVLFSVAGLIAVSALVGLMVRRRDRLVEKFRLEIAEEKQRLAKQKKPPTDQRTAA